MNIIEMYQNVQRERLPLLKDLLKALGIGLNKEQKLIVNEFIEKSMKKKDLFLIFLSYMQF